MELSNLETEASESIENDNTSNQHASKVQPMSLRQKCTLCALSFACFSSSVVYSCIGPFFPGVAKSKGASETEIGFIFGVYQLVTFVLSPIWGHVLPDVGARHLFGLGVFLNGFSMIMFGCLIFVKDMVPFVTLCFILRILSAVGDSAFRTTSFAIVPQEFPNRIATAIGMLETFFSVGFVVGPIVGGALYQAGGYPLPFAVLGCLLLISSVVSSRIISSTTEEIQGNQLSGVSDLLKMPRALLIGITVSNIYATLGFLDSSMELHLESFNLSPIVIGVVFLLIAGTIVPSAPFWGYIIDRYKSAIKVMCLGSAVVALSLTFVGPAPYLGITKNIWLISFCQMLTGFGICAINIGSFPEMVKTARDQGYGDSLETHAVVSGFFQSCFSLGGFLGPTLGNVSVEHFGFAWTATALSTAHIFAAVMLMVLLLFESWRFKKNQREMFALNEWTLNE